MAELHSSTSTLTESRSDEKVERPRMWRVLLHNDDYTTQEFVVWVLETVFRKPRCEAVRIMMSVHLSGSGSLAIYTHDVAETKLRKTRQMAEEQEFPLLVTMEPEPDQNMSKTPVPFAPETLRNDSAGLPSRDRASSRRGRARAPASRDHRRTAGAARADLVRREPRSASPPADGRALEGLHPGAWPRQSSSPSRRSDSNVSCSRR